MGPGPARGWFTSQLSGSMGPSLLPRKRGPALQRGEGLAAPGALYPTLCDTMDCSMPGLPDHHQLPEFTQTHAHCLAGLGVLKCAIGI